MKNLIDVKNKTIQIEWNEKNGKGIVLVLKQGAILQKVGASVDKPTLELRSKATKEIAGKITTIMDLTFNTKSSLSNFICGCQFSGQRWCETHLGIPNSNASCLSASNTTTPTPTIVSNATTTKASTPNSELSVKELLKAKQEVADQFFTYCKDFAFEDANGCGPRILNSVYYEQNPNDFILNSMELVGFNPDVLKEAKSKMSSLEFKEILKKIKSFATTHERINQRLEIFYGPAGTGKTTRAEIENKGCDKIVASASADPDDLFTIFSAECGKVILTPLGNAMVNGKPIIIDEANLYNKCIMERLQGITDNTKTIKDRNLDIEIKDGFKIIITMNLETNFGKFALPVPLVNRASRIVKMDKVDYSWVW